MSIDPKAPLAWTVDDALSPAQCEALRARFSALPMEEAPITTGAGFVRRPDVRNNQRSMADDLDLAQALYAVARPHLPERLRGGTLCGLNERFRFYRYTPGQYFAPHYDGAFVRNRLEYSLVTVMLYLNEGAEGGETRFLDLGETVVPKTGRMLFFQHRLLHEGCPVTAGIKDVLRTDAMYRF